MNIRGRRYDTGEVVEVACTGGRIERIDEVDEDASATHLFWLGTGLVDIQVNGFDGQEFSSAKLTTEHVGAIVRRHDAFGVTELCPTVTTEGFEVMAHAVRTIAQACQESPEVDRRVLGIHIEGPYISPIDGPRGAHPLQHCRPPDWDEFQRLQQAAGGRIRLLTLSPEYDEAPKVIAQLVASGVVVAIGHTAANSTQIRAAVDAGASISTHLGNGAHRELRRHPNYLWDQLADDRLTAGLIVDGHHLPGEVVKVFLRAKTPQRCVLVSDVSGLAGLPVGRYTSNLCELEIQADGRIVIAGQSQLLAGASLPLGVGVANVMRFAGVDLQTAVDMASCQPARLLGKEHLGLAVGQKADLVLFDLAGDPSGGDGQRFEVHATISGGELIYPWPDS